MSAERVFSDSVLICRVINRMPVARLRRAARVFGSEQTAAYATSIAARWLGLPPPRSLEAAERALPDAMRVVTGRTPSPAAVKAAREHLRRVVLG